ncbi:MAG TPA: putative Ig domain-containing protein [Candidatus Acidoferrales bacterium]|nr:putative Ig domain-containing protein [Candidatus Acidoferrales bacterium]
MATAKRTGFPPILCLAMLFFVQNYGCLSCSGIPSNFNSVVLSASARQIGPNGVVTITATVPKDTTGAGVTWTSNAPPNPGTFTPTSVTQSSYTAPSSVASQFTVTITATTLSASITPPEVASITITVTPPQPLSITTTTLPSGIVGKAYPAGTQLQATGGVTPYTWALTATSSPLPAGLTLAADGTITGTPTASGTFNFNVQVTDSDTPPVVKTAPLTIKVTDLLTGKYAFEFSGFKANGTVVVAGSFTSDGLGNITAGVEDLNSITGPPTSGTLETFTGTYTLGADNRGTLTFITNKSGTLVYAFALDATGVHGRMVEFDTTSGIRGSGELAQQTTSTCGANTLSGSSGTGFAIEVLGAAGSFPGVSPGAVAFAGRFTAEVPPSSGSIGTIDNGEIDANVPNGTAINPLTLSGTFQTTAQTARCTMSVSPSTLASETFSVYPISSTAGLLTEAFVVETDTVSAGTPYITAGKLIQQVGFPFTVPSNLFTATSVAGLSGNAIPNGGAAYQPFAGIAELTPTGGGAFTMPLVFNLGGAVSTNLGAGAISANLQTGDSFGRVPTNLVGGFVPAFYVINTNEALFILENPNAGVVGILEPQSKGTGNTFSAATVKGTLVQGTAAPDTSATTDLSGVMVLDGVSAAAGTQDRSTSVANTAGELTTGNYVLTASGTTDGSGTLNLTQTPPPPHFNGEFFIVSPTKLVMITTTPGDATPVLIFLGEQTDGFGVN